MVDTIKTRSEDVALDLAFFEKRSIILDCWIAQVFFVQIV